MTEHLLEMAKALVRIKDGMVCALSDPQIKSCPLRRSLYGIAHESRESVEQVLCGHMQDLGMYGPDRVLELEEKPVSFGASEILRDALVEGLIDAAVLVCEGAGSVVATRPEVLQAIGAHMTGLVKTEPIVEIQEGLERKGCLLADRIASVDQLSGFKVAARAGYKRIAVTVAGNEAKGAQKLREFGYSVGLYPVILAVHTTGIFEEDAVVLAENADIVWACASRAVREVIGGKAKLQIGISIPVFALTDQGKRLVLNRAMHFSDSLVLYRSRLPNVPAEKQPEPLI